MPRSARLDDLGLTTEGGTKFKLKGWNATLKYYSVETQSIVEMQLLIDGFLFQKSFTTWGRDCDPSRSDQGLRTCRARMSWCSSWRDVGRKILTSDRTFLSSRRPSGNLTSKFMMLHCWASRKKKQCCRISRFCQVSTGFTFLLKMS